MNFLKRIYVVEIGKGLLLTAWHFWKNLFLHTAHLFGILRKVPAGVTVQYPEVRRNVAARARHVHRLLRRSDGTPKCVACMLCPTVCPAECINVVAEESPDRAIEKRPARFEIDLSRCIFCGFCVEACPVDAIRMDTGVIPPATFDRYSLIMKKEDLLAMEPSTGKLRTISGRF